MQRFVYSVAFLALLGAALIGALDEKEALAKFIEMAEICKAEVGASDADIQGAVKHEAASTYEGKCLRACVMKKFHVLGENGKLDVEAGREKAKKYTGNDPAKLEKALEIGDICAALAVPDDHCEAAEKYSMCFKSEAEKRGLV